ncbi:MAG: hypothetical protein AMXMBFR64_01930 [Myxococcales bacterium]
MKWALAFLLSAAGCAARAGDAATDAGATHDASAAAPGDGGDVPSLVADASQADSLVDPSGPQRLGPALGGPYPLLSDYRLFTGDPALQVPSPGVLPYEVAAPLWSDHARKHRFLVLPPGEVAAPTPDDTWALPVGTILVKTFGFAESLDDPDSPELLVETRLLIHEDRPSGPTWGAYVYLWTEDQSDAVRLDGGTIVKVSYSRDAQALETPYVVPNTNQCVDCHALHKVARPIGITTRQLARQVKRGEQVVDQLAWLAAQGALMVPPQGEGLADPYGDGPVEPRARAWLDANCGHCHRDGGSGGPSGLSLLASESDPARYGVCKPPVAAGPGTGGRHHDIVPGDPDASILVYRIASTSPAVKMPEIPNLLVDEPGISLIRDWISAMPPQDCGPTP